MKSNWDYIVVGAGSGGCVVANRLGEGGRKRVLVLEAGGRDWSPYLQIPVGRIRMNVKYDWYYPAEPDTSRNGREEHWEAGKVIGGTSSINGMNWARGDRADYDGWAKLGCTGWDYDSVLPYFKRSERFEGGASELRGGDGPVSVTMPRADHPLNAMFLETAVNAGETYNPDVNGEHSGGVAYQQVSQRRGLRHSAARAYLAPALRRRNVRLRTGALTRRVLIEGGRAVGVEYEHRGRVRTARCSGEVIVSAGAIGSPKILMLSGVGPSERLGELGIPVAADLPGVGRHLKNHMGSIMLFEVDVPTLNREFTFWKIMRHGANLVLRGRGAATMAMGNIVVSGSITGERIDYKYGFGPYGRFRSKETGRYKDTHKLQISSSQAVTLRPGLMQPMGEGSVSIRSADPHDPPVIRYEVFEHPEDLASYTAVCRRVREVMATEPIASHIVRELQPGPEVQSDEEWEAQLRASADVGKHLCGTCKMGVDDLAVVDTELRVRGVAGLRVVDASVMPNVPSDGTNAPTIMIAERAADFIKSATAAS